jgi:hypothetical protein
MLERLANANAGLAAHAGSIPVTRSLLKVLVKASVQT